MSADSARSFRRALHELGLTDAAISAAWPRWWSDEADESASARAELRFGVARRLGLDPRSLFDAGAPRFLWRDEARFKHLAGETDLERAGITSFGRAVAASLVALTQKPVTSIHGATAAQLRQSVLQSRPYVGLLDLVALAWGIGVPLVHLRVFPWRQKRMSAMSVSIGDRAVILLSKDSMYPAPLAFYVAHEIAHVALGHVSGDRLIVDLEDETPVLLGDDPEEAQADAFALELLTGNPRPTIVPGEGSARATARELARISVQVSHELRVEPGVIAQCFGYSTGNWRVANGALKVIYTDPAPAWSVVNAIAREQLHFDDASAETVDFLDAVLGDDGAA